jgi:hypothetical protein
MKRRTGPRSRRAFPGHPDQPESQQPDFGADFYADNAAPIRYHANRYRLGNFRHDIVYLSSYIHDAEVRLDELRLRRKSLVIPLNRARWELDRGVGDLAYIRSKLTISPVLSVSLELNHTCFLQKTFFHAPTVVISKLQNISEQWEDSDDEGLILDFAFRSKLRLRCGPDLTVKLVDRVPLNMH